jgi:hypothetical protein
MLNQKTIVEFFEEQFQNTWQLFLYKDKQLLNQEKYVEYAKEQIKKAQKAFWSIAFGIFFVSWYGLTGLIEYGRDPNWLDLSIGVGSWVFLIIGLILASKEYYTVKSSMTLLIKMSSDSAFKD